MFKVEGSSRRAYRQIKKAGRCKGQPALSFIFSAALLFLHEGTDRFDVRAGYVHEVGTLCIFTH